MSRTPADINDTSKCGAAKYGDIARLNFEIIKELFGNQAADFAAQFAAQQAEITALAESLAIGWVTALDIDFTTLPNQEIANDGAVEIDGIEFTKINSAKDAAPMTIMNGAGLVIQPAAATNYLAADRTLPALTVNLASLIEYLDHATELRVYLYIAAANFAAAYDGVILAIESDASRTDIQMAKGHFGGLGVRFDCTTDYLGTNGGELAQADNAGAHDVMVMHSAEDLNWYTGIYSSGWPNPKTGLYTNAVKGWYSGSNTPSSSLAWLTPDHWNLLFGARRAGSLTALSVTIGRVKLEYKN